MPQIAPDITNTSNASSDLRHFSQISAFRQGLEFDDSDSGIQTVLSDEASTLTSCDIDSDGSESPVSVSDEKASI